MGIRLEMARGERGEHRDVLEVTASRAVLRGGRWGTCLDILDLHKLGRLCCSLKIEQDFGILKESMQK